MCMVNITVSSFSSVSCNLDSWKVILVSTNKQKIIIIFLWLHFCYQHNYTPSPDSPIWAQSCPPPGNKSFTPDLQALHQKAVVNKAGAFVLTTPSTYSSVICTVIKLKISNKMAVCYRCCPLTTKKEKNIVLDQTCITGQFGQRFQWHN